MATCEELAKQKTDDDDDSDVIVPREDVHAFCMRCLQKVGAVTEHAEAMAELIVAADYRGFYSHGLNRLDFYMEDLRSGQVISKPEVNPAIVKETVATALVDGNNLMGPVVGTFAMDLAIRKAKQAGIGWVSVKGSNHFGIAGWYSMRAMEQELITALGTNPISVAAPADDGDSFVLDMATTVVALGKVEIKHTLQQPLPSGWSLDKDGRPTTDIEKAMTSVALYPLGGAEETSGYKGYGLAMMVEVFCSILSGATATPFGRMWGRDTEPGGANLGHCFVALDPQVFAPGFTDRLSELLNHCRNLPPAEGESEVLVPGDPERQHVKKCDALGGIPYEQNQIQWAHNLAEKNGLAPLVRLSG
ncbi:hypothetical protein C0Q70_08706 [Pomacea canaliculata]|uniref:Malate dehydrogenase n=1 Tax=Pomacea canaliculata TaxID=400727 RepID=A0A2T7P7P9_POMCA|nr:hypothetical protein C0Q70_08706 [Pomacea canaliculata]